MTMSTKARNIDKVFQGGLASHQAGHLVEAEQAYNEVLSRRPKHVDANSLLGTVHLQTGRLDSARILLEKAVKLQPEHFVARNNLGHVLQDRGMLKEAIKHYEQAIKYKPDFFDAYNNLGTALREAKEFERAASVLEKLVHVDPTNSSAHYNLGLVRLQQKRVDEAVAELGVSVELNPAHIEGWTNYGTALRDKGHFDKAISAFDKALELDPTRFEALCGKSLACSAMSDFDSAKQTLAQIVWTESLTPEAYAALGTAYSNAGQLKVAVKAFNRAIESKPDYCEAYSNLSCVLQACDELNEALLACERALEINPEFLSARINRATTLAKLLKFRESEQELNVCLQSDPTNDTVLQAMGSVLDMQMRRDEALTFYDRALQSAPKRPDIHWNRGLSLLAAGRLEEGWDEYDWGMQTKERALAVRYSYPIWRGENLKDKTILLYAEQGLGDEILFASCFPQIIDQAGRCIIQCDPRLKALYERSFPRAVIYAGKREAESSWLASFGGIDFQSPIGSVPRYLRRRIEDFPSHNVFLRADPKQSKNWKSRLDSMGETLKVGIAWRSGLTTGFRKTGYTLIEDWADVFAVQGITFVNLQYGECKAELARAKDKFGVQIVDFSELDLYNDLDGQTALIDALDVVISVGISVYNFAGALGKETWLLVPPGTSWVNVGTQRIPWFPSLKMYSQSQLGDWTPVMRKLADDLAVVASKSRSMVCSELQAEPGNGAKANQNSVQQLLATGCEAAERGQWVEAEFTFRKVLVSQPNEITALYNLGTCLYQLGRYEEAADYFEKALELQPDNITIRENVAVTYYQMERWESAIEVWEGLLESGANPDRYLDALSIAYVRVDRALDAISVIENSNAVSLNLDRKFTLAWANLESGRRDRAAELFDEIVNARPDHVEARYNRGLLRLADGNLQDGWKDVACRFSVPGSGTVLQENFARYPRWQGQVVAGKSVLVYGEQGVGDEILFASCIPDLARAGARIILLTDMRLVSLFARSFPYAAVHGALAQDVEQWLAERGEIDYQAPIGDLPAAFRTKFTDFPPKNAYLVPDPVRVKAWREKLAQTGKGVKVGIAWRSGIFSPLRARSYTDLAEDWGPVLTVDGADFINLQYSDVTSELDAVRGSLGVTVNQMLGLDLYNDFEETAALIVALDLVISVGTSVYNLAGALGQQTWMPLPWGRSWVNMGTNDIPWYPSVKVFQQDLGSGWTPVFQRIRGALEERVNTGDCSDKPQPIGSILADVVGSAARVGWIGTVPVSQSALIRKERTDTDFFEISAGTENSCDVLLVGGFSSNDGLQEGLSACHSVIRDQKPIIICFDGESEYQRGFLAAMSYQWLQLSQLASLNSTVQVYVPLPPSSRAMPSARYTQLVEYYIQMHREGAHRRRRDGEESQSHPEATFSGWQLPLYAKPIGAMIRTTAAKSILDYGAGKGKQYEWDITIDGRHYPNIQTFWGIQKIVCYEPAVDGWDALPDKPCDGVVCTDVLEHVPEQDLVWVIRELFAHAEKFVFTSIACYPATAILPDGTNAHCTVRPIQWWSGFFSAIAPDYAGVLFLNAVVTGESATNDGEDIVWQANFPLPKS